ncbi:hypothetical protein V8E54_015011 [Elaphomyces granulatus]
MRFINIVLLELCAVAGSIFASAYALPQRFDGQVHQNPITGNCLQGPHVLKDAQIDYFPNVVNDIPINICTPLDPPGDIRVFRTDTKCVLYNNPRGHKPCDHNDPSKSVDVGEEFFHFWANYIFCA